jgi:hypothetical protein
MKINRRAAIAVPIFAFFFAALFLIGLSLTACKDGSDSNETPTAADYTVGKLSQTEGSVTAVTIRPKRDKSGGAITIYYEGTGGTAYPRSKTIPKTAGTYNVTFDVAEASGWNAASGLFAGILTIIAAEQPPAGNQTPTAADYTVGNLTQTLENFTAVTIEPKPGKSTGTVTIYYNGVTALPTEVGTYTVTFDVAEANGWDSATGLIAGTLTVSLQVNAQSPSITGQPSGATVTINTSYSLSVAASVSDGGSLSYQWYSNTGASNTGGTVITGATAAEYNPPTGTVGTYSYFVEVTNTISNNGDGGKKTASVRSDAVTLTVNTLVNAQTPAITSQPTGATVVFNASHSLSVAANVSDGGSLSYRWYSNTSPSNSGGTAIPEAESATYNPSTVTIGTFYYFAEVTNTISDNGDGGVKTASVRSNAVTFTVNKAIGTFGAPAAIDTTYTPTLTLASLALPSGYAWNAPATSLNAGNGQSFPATYTDPSGNYTTASGAITVNVAKASGVFGPLAAINTTYAPVLRLSHLTLPSGYTWNAPATSLNAGNGQLFPATYTDASGNYTASGDITVNVAKERGTTVSAPTLSVITQNSITVNLVTASNGQQVEYAISVNSVAPSSGWQSSPTFTGLNDGTTYYIFARSAANNNYETGAASYSLAVTLRYRIEYYWVNQQDTLVTTSGGTAALNAGETLTITAQASGYVVRQWHLNGMNTGQSGNTYIFSSTTAGKYTVGLFVEKDGRLYNTNITITVK